MLMTEIARLNGVSDQIAVEFEEREATPQSVMKLTLHLHLCGLSLSNTVSVLESLEYNRARSTVHNWI